MKPNVKFISLWLVVWDSRNTIKQLVWSEILSEGTFVISSIIVSLLSDKGASLTRRGMLYIMYLVFFSWKRYYNTEIMLLQKWFHSIVLLTIKKFKGQRNDRRLASSHIKFAKRMYQFLDHFFSLFLRPSQNKSTLITVKSRVLARLV